MDHYKTLGIDRDSSKSKIEKAYKRLARKIHPDKNRASDAKEKFQALNEAYEVLVDDHKRAAYDKFDLPKTRSHHSHSSSHSHHQHHSRHQRRDDNFFRGASAALSEEQKYKNELDRIRRINSDLLDEANAKLRRANRKSSSTRETKKDQFSGGAMFLGEKFLNMDIEEYENFVFDELRRKDQQPRMS